MKTIITMIIVAIISVKAIFAFVDTAAPVVYEGKNKTEMYLSSIDE